MQMRLRRFIGVASLFAILVFVANPEILAFTFMVSSIGFDVFLLFLTFQFQSHLEQVLFWARQVAMKVRTLRHRDP
jgi:hypothetical protein